MNTNELQLVVKKHRMWLKSEKSGERADLRNAYLRNAYLRNADLRGAHLSGAYLSDADLRGANLRNAYLRDADLRGANLRNANLRNAYLRDTDLRGANLRNAYLSDADLRGAVGNGREIITTQTDIWTVNRTASHMQIGCERHLIDDWWVFNDDRIAAMESRALDWWHTWKPILQQIIEACPAQPTRAGEDEVAT